MARIAQIKDQCGSAASVEMSFHDVSEKRVITFRRDYLKNVVMRIGLL
jgi:hypothetical protein